MRTRRARLSPGDIGLPPGIRRRTTGLRREEVAQLANIGTSWYTALEQGRDIQASDQVLNSLADALRLTYAEKRHLFLLAQPDMAGRPPASPEETISGALEQAIHALNPHPVYVMGRRWDLLAWNRAAELVFSFSAIGPPHHRNFLWRSFTDPVLLTHKNWAQLAQSVISQFRADSARYPGDPSFAELVNDLTRTSEDFRKWWPRHDVRSIPEGNKRMEHPVYGLLEFHHTTLQVPANADQKVILYTCAPSTATLLSEVLQVGTSAAGDQPVGRT